MQCLRWTGSLLQPQVALFPETSRTKERKQWLWENNIKCRKLREKTKIFTVNLKGKVKTDDPRTDF